MNPRMKLAATAVSAVAIGGAGLLTAPTASAAPSGSVAPPGSDVAGTAPACVDRYVTGTPNGFDVLLTNNCGKTMRVKVVVNNSGDSPCYTMGAGGTRLYVYEGVLGSYDRTVVC
ncbi:hypothetical protein [Streptomyces oceani]|uniref:Beta-Ig-H3/fasciclin n=1 Tax=Streptomyces oceani TaxID=1075402 RepID=A0A1E7KJ55_9ACTN|nr:hypothetical protein [Streptomyces oceani]OEV03926.1 hypothetical protein AN216_09885 [Streptomyces oceani]